MKRQIAISLPAVGEDEWMAVRDPLSSGWLTQGPKVAEFEKQFAVSCKAKHALAVTSCTTALHLALCAAGIGPGDEVLVPSFSWVSTANAVEYCGATPVFVDVDTNTFNICLSSLEQKITARTKAVIPVHLFGLCADMDAIKAIVPDHVFVLEDAACAAGALYKGHFAGTLGHAACFSFHPRKVLTTGEGGMVTTNDLLLHEKMSVLRSHGASTSAEMKALGPKPHFFADFDVVGFNYRMTDVQGAIGIVQLSKLERFIQERADWAKWYSSQLADIEWIRCPQFGPESGRHAWQAYVLYIDPSKSPLPRNLIMEKLQEMGVATRAGTQAIHMLGYYKNKYLIEGSDLPAAKACYENSMAIPLDNRMVSADYEYVVQCLRSFNV